MNDYQFTLILSGVSEITPELANALYEATGGDIEFNMREGVAFLEFDRTAASLHDAITSSITQVESAGVGVRVVRVESDNANTIAKINADRDRSVDQFRRGETFRQEIPDDTGRVATKSIKRHEKQDDQFLCLFVFFVANESWPRRTWIRRMGCEWARSRCRGCGAFVAGIKEPSPSLPADDSSLRLPTTRPSASGTPTTDYAEGVSHRSPGSAKRRSREAPPWVCDPFAHQP